MVVVPIVSSAIQQVEYHPKTKDLDILFNDGDFRSYKDVPEQVYLELIKSPSAGRYFNFSIRDVFKYE